MPEITGKKLTAQICLLQNNKQSTINTKRKKYKGQKQKEHKTERNGRTLSYVQTT